MYDRNAIFSRKTIISNIIQVHRRFFLTKNTVFFLLFLRCGRRRFLERVVTSSCSWRSGDRGGYDDSVRRDCCRRYPLRRLLVGDIRETAAVVALAASSDK